MDPLLVSVFLLVLVLIFAHTVETVLGFGATIIALALGIFIFPLETILPVLVILGLLQSLWLVARWFKYIRWPVLLLNILPAAIIGMAIGISYRTLVGNYTQLLIFWRLRYGCLVMEIILIYKQGQPEACLVSGLADTYNGQHFHGIFASGSPLIIYYSSRELKEPAEFRATISMLWLILAVILVVNLYSIGQININTLATTGIVLPGLILGIIFGSRMTFRTLVFKVLIYTLLFIAGLLLVVQQIVYR
jgi:hypothetical protein